MKEIKIASLNGTCFPAKANTGQEPVLFMHEAFADHKALQNSTGRERKAIIRILI
jgi:hypothetical protein